jgi:hypothetical protein
MSLDVGRDCICEREWPDAAALSFRWVQGSTSNPAVNATNHAWLLLRVT